MRLVVLGVVGCLVGGSVAMAQQNAGEQLFVPPPNGWKVGFHDRKGNVDVTEVVPAGQTVTEWSEMLTVQVISGKPSKAAQDVLKDQLVDIQNACEDVGAGQANLGVENGYETALRAVACTKSKQWGKGELNLYKVLVGRDRIYIVSRSWRGEPFQKDRLPIPPEKTAEWLGFMQHVVVCDSRDPKHPCPSTDQAGGAAPQR